MVEIMQIDKIAFSRTSLTAAIIITLFFFLICGCPNIERPPGEEPTVAPTMNPTTDTTAEPTTGPTTDPTDAPTTAPTMDPTTAPAPRDLNMGFEISEDLTGWISYNVDGGFNTQFNFDTFWELFDLGTDAHGGIGSMCSVYNDTGAPNNDWLVTPAVIPSGTTQLSFWASPMDQDWACEVYDVKISTTGQDPATFGSSLLHYEFPAGTAPNWHQSVLDLSGYAGQTIYITIQCTSPNQYMLAIDDILITDILN